FRPITQPSSPIRITATSSSDIRPCERSSEISSRSSVSRPFFNSTSKLERACSSARKYQHAIASDSIKSTSSFFSDPLPLTTLSTANPCSLDRDGTSSGVALNCSDFAKGSEVTTELSRQCTRHESPSAIACQLGAGASSASCTPTKAAKEPVRAFSSEYHESRKPLHESCSTCARPETKTQKSSGV